MTEGKQTTALGAPAPNENERDATKVYQIPLFADDKRVTPNTSPPKKGRGA